MLFLLTCWVAFKSMKAMTAVASFHDFMDFAESVMDAEKLREYEEEAELDINRKKEAWQLAEYGRAEMLRTCDIVLEDLPGPALDWLIGKYAFFPSEEEKVQRWIIDAWNAVVSGEENQNTDDIHRLLYVGRARLDNKWWREQVSKNEAEIEEEKK